MIELFSNISGSPPDWLMWVASVSWPAVVLFSGWVYFKLDSRYELKSEAETKVEELKKADAEIKLMVEELTRTVSTHNESSVASIATVRAEMNNGFSAVTKTINDAALSLTKDVAQMQGRLAGAGGITKSDQ